MKKQKNSFLYLLIVLVNEELKMNILTIVFIINTITTVYMIYINVLFCTDCLCYPIFPSCS